jgi:hypothetical protein
LFYDLHNFKKGTMSFTSIVDKHTFEAEAILGEDEDRAGGFITSGEEANTGGSLRGRHDENYTV